MDTRIQAVHLSVKEFFGQKSRSQPCTVKNFRRVQNKVYLVEYRDDDGEKFGKESATTELMLKMRFQEVKLRKENKSVEVESNITIKNCLNGMSNYWKSGQKVLTSGLLQE